MLHILLTIAVAAPMPHDEAAAETLPIAVLYAGNAGTPYTAAWEAFLGAHVARVKSIAGSAVRREDLVGFDALIVDGEVDARDEKGQPALKIEKMTLRLDELQGFPVLLMGGQGGWLADELHLKTSWRAG